MDRLSAVIQTADYILDTRRKRHIVGGLMLSAALLFGGIALTIMTIKSEDDYVEQ